MDQVDLVWFQEFLGLQSNLTLFWQQLDGFINLFPGSSYNFRNTANYHSQGLEWELSKALGSHEIWGNGYYTLAEASDFDTSMAYNNRRVDLDGRLLSYSPWGGNLGSTLRFAEGKYYTSPHVRIAGPAKYRLAEVKRPALDNEMYYAETNTMIYLNLSLGYEPIRSLSLSLYIDNLLNLTGPVPMTVWNGTIEQQGIELSGRIAYRF